MECLLDSWHLKIGRQMPLHVVKEGEKLKYR